MTIARPATIGFGERGHLARAVTRRRNVDHLNAAALGGWKRCVVLLAVVLGHRADDDAGFRDRAVHGAVVFPRRVQYAPDLQLTVVIGGHAREELRNRAGADNPLFRGLTVPIPVEKFVVDVLIVAEVFVVNVVLAVVVVVVVVLAAGVFFVGFLVVLIEFREGKHRLDRELAAARGRGIVDRDVEVFRTDSAVLPGDPE